MAQLRKGTAMPRNRMRINRHALAELREARAVSKREMADALGCSLGHYCDIETGRRQATPKLIAAIADALKIRPLAIIENPNELDDLAEAAS